MRKLAEKLGALGLERRVAAVLCVAVLAAVPGILYGMRTQAAGRNTFTTVTEAHTAIISQPAYVRGLPRWPNPPRQTPVHVEAPQETRREVSPVGSSPPPKRAKEAKKQPPAPASGYEWTGTERK